MKNYTISTPKEYEKNGEKKTTWLNVGYARLMDDGKIFIDLNMFPGQTFLANEAKPKIEQQEVKTDNIPF